MKLKLGMQQTYFLPLQVLQEERDMQVARMLEGDD